jgi:hypothetical protein
MRPLSALVSLIAATALMAAEPDKDGFVPLFNGKDLSGWVPVNVHPKTFFVKDGEIVTTGQPIGYMRSDKQYENFILEMEWMHVNKDKVGNSGLFIWGDTLPVVGSPFTRGIEVQVLVNLEYKDKEGRVTASSHGDVFSIQGATCKPDRPHPNPKNMRCIPSEFRAKGGGEWNHYRVTAKDGAIKLAVNGKEVSGVSECKPHRKGYLALESEGAECHFRNIKIKELPSSNPKPGEIAKPDAGHKLLFNGLDLAGWKTEKGSWAAGDGRLKAVGKADLVSDKSFEKYELLFDYKMPAGSKDEWSLALGPGQQYTITDAAPEGRGRWMRFQATVGPDEVTRLVDGVPTTVRPGFGAGPIVFKPARGLELMNVFVRDLK